MAAFTSAIIGGLATAGGFLAANAGTIATIGSTISGVAGAITGEETKKQQAEALKKQQEVERQAIEKEKAKALADRTEKINKQRRQLVGAGNYSIGQTGSAGLTAATAGTSLLG